MKIRQIFKYCLSSIWWLSGLVFVYFIFKHYLLTIPNYSTAWNFRLPNLGTDIYGAIFIGIHFVGGVIVLVVGQIQLFTAKRYNFLHRILGRIYLISSLLLSLCGIMFIYTKSTIGGNNMSASFYIYGYLLFTFSIFTWIFGYKRMIKEHREWALRTYILGISSWFYRIFYLVSMLFGYKIDTTNSADYLRPLDIFFVWGFYLPGLILMEIYIRYKRRKIVQKNTNYVVLENGDINI